MRLLAEMNSDKYSIIKQHEEYLEIIKNKSIDKIDEIVKKHIKEPAKEWSNIGINYDM
ncbi:hypothetical protein SDC9_147997 [bioreactor metagenome]|uniref:GntR C-terminal domain-containing protein n=1 Tax=bioreactor metagenome TaxID=1076179 RepID=A0A645EI24_9ZZZZ